MNPLVTWISDHLGVLLIGGLVVAVAMLLLGIRAAWRTARKLRGPQRSIVRFALSLVLLLAGLGAGLFCGAGLVAMGPGMWAQREMLDNSLQDFEFALVENDSPGHLADFRGQVVLLNVWATWCPPCREEMEDLDRLHRTWAEEGLVVLFLSDENRETLLGWIETEPSAAVHAYSQPIPLPESGRPTTYIVDREGVLRRVLIGQRSYEQFEAEIRRHL